MVTGFPGQEAKVGRQLCHLLPGLGQERFQQALGAAPDTPIRLLPPFLWSTNPQVPWEASPDVTECAVGTTAHCWEMAVGICQGKNAFVQSPKEGAWKPRHGNRKPSWELLGFRHEIAFWTFSKPVGS